MPPKSKPLTHFLCLPLATQHSTPQLTLALQRFAQELTKSAASTNLSETNTSPTSPSPSKQDAADTSAAFSKTSAAECANGAPVSSAAHIEAPERQSRKGTESSDVEHVPRSNQSIPRWPTIPPTAIRPPGTLHLTLGVMSLQDPAHLATAVRLLRDLDLPALLQGSGAGRRCSSPDKTSCAEKSSVVAEAPPQDRSSPSLDGVTTVFHPATEEALQATSVLPLVVTLRSLSAMRDPRRTSVLYFEPDDATGRLMGFCERVRGVFEREGLVQEEGRAWKGHATILNTIYASGGRRRRTEEDVGARESRSEDEKEGGDKDGALNGSADAREGTEQMPVEKVVIEKEDESGAAEDVVGKSGSQHAPEKPGGDSGGKGRKKKKQQRAKPIKFDARALLERWKDEVWAEIKVEKLAICEMEAKEDAGKVRYVEVADVKLPD